MFIVYILYLEDLSGSPSWVFSINQPLSGTAVRIGGAEVRQI